MYEVGTSYYIKTMNLVLFNDTDQLYQATKQLFAEFGFALKGDTNPYSLPFVLDNLPANIPEVHKKLLANENIKVYFMGVVNEDTLNSKIEHLFDREAARKGKYNEEGENGRNGLGVVALDLDFEPKKADLVALVRMFNRNFETSPIILVMRYNKTNSSGGSQPPDKFISIASSFRRERIKNSQYLGEVVEKVYVLKDVNVANPHRGHLDTLADLKPRKEVATFEELYLQWLEVFSTKLLGKKFYQDVIKWYGWAIKEVQFPQLLPKANEPERIANETYQEQSVLRLFTRLMFCWFMKERNLIPEKAFDKKLLQTEIKDFGAKDNYYKTVLQNMFFATLSVPMENRRFVKKYESDFRSKDYGNQYAYRHHKLLENTGFIKELFEKVPFLNGGLFECLDKVEREENDKAIAETEKRIDGFSETQYKQAKVPDVLFFGEKANKGLIEIFEKYKFTIEENTPTEEEIALPPIMLGTVFENLLAYHTDDTGKEARKSKGAYYTPTEIVYYMVEESLLAFLKNKIAAPLTPEGGVLTPNSTPQGLKALAELKRGDLHQKLENLVREKTTSNEFSPAETRLLIETLFSCKILDPACGSGAFPYTLLDKLVKILNILDADNNYIEQVLAAQQEKENQALLQQIAADYLPKRNELLQNKKIVEQITIDELRKQNIADLNRRLDELTKQYEDQLQKLRQAFNPEENEKDYGKKLYLIQNCIFGVDILPIAIHISKLRFFLSLLISQKENPEKKNRGILPLPNLDTKFIAANTLIAPEKDAQKPANMYITDIKAKQETQKELRAKHLHANNHAAKEQLAKQDIALQKEIAEMLWLSYNNPRSFDNSVQLANYLQEIDIQTAPYSVEIEKLTKQLKDANKDHKKAINSKISVAIQAIDKIHKDTNYVQYKIWLPTFADIDQLAAYTPYNQEKIAALFEPEWMLGCKEFDVVIGNPPYVQLQKMKAQQESFEKQGYTTYSKAADLYCLFYEKGVQLLKEQGILAYITSNSWMRTQYGELLRVFFAEQTNPLLLLNFENSQVFESAIVESNILITQKTMPLPKNTTKNIQLKAVTVKEDAKNISLPTYVAEKHILLTELDTKGWIIGNSKTILLKKKIESDTILLGNLGVTMDYGVKTGFSEAFFIDKETKELLVSKNPKNLEIIKPFLRGRDLLKYTYNWAELWFINAHNGIKAKNISPVNIEKDYPELYQYFSTYEIQLKKRADKGQHWTNLRDCAYIENFAKPKIIWIVLSDKGKFAYDDKGYYTNDSCFIMTGENLKYLLAILNSKVAEWYFNQISTSSGMGTNMWKKYKVEQLPIKNISISEQQPFVLLVDKILEAKAQGENTQVLENEIDMLVFGLYGLTEEEIKICTQ